MGRRWLDRVMKDTFGLFPRLRARRGCAMKGRQAVFGGGVGGVPASKTGKPWLTG